MPPPPISKPAVVRAATANSALNARAPSPDIQRNLRYPEPPSGLSRPQPHSADLRFLIEAGACKEISHVVQSGGVGRRARQQENVQGEVVKKLDDV